MKKHESAAAAVAAGDEQTAQRLQLLMSLRGRNALEYAQQIVLENQQYVHENQQLQEKVGQLCVTQEELREKLEALCAPEHYPVVITKVSNNGSLSVDVSARGGPSLRVAVHPEVPPDRLCVGRVGILSKARNCLMHVEESEPEWRDVAEFEDFLSGRRILLKYQEHLVGATLSEDLIGKPLKKGDLIGFDREMGLAYVLVAPPATAALFSNDIPHDDFSRLGGLEKPIAQVQRAIDFCIRFPDVAQRYGVRSKRGILLCGPPGNGKTRIGRCAAAYVGALMDGTPCRFMSLIGASDVYSMWLGESERRLRERFAAAEEAATQGPVVVFFDELDALGRRRGSDHGSGAPDRVLNTLLGLLDGIKQLSNVIVMAATNRPDTLDPGLVRPGRFDLKITIPGPNRRAAFAVLQLYLSGLPLASEYASWDQLIEPVLARIYSPNSEYCQVASVKLSDGRNLPVAAKDLISGAMLENITHVAAEQAALREIQSGVPGGLTEDDLLAALHHELCGITSLLTPANVKSYVTVIPQDAQPVAVSPSHRSANTPLYIR